MRHGYVIATKQLPVPKHVTVSLTLNLYNKSICIKNSFSAKLAIEIIDTVQIIYYFKTGTGLKLG